MELNLIGLVKSLGLNFFRSSAVKVDILPNPLNKVNPPTNAVVLSHCLELLKGAEPQKVVGKIIASPRAQLLLGSAMALGGSATVEASDSVPDFSVEMVYLGIVSIGLGIILTTMCIVHRAILINKDLKNKE